MDKKPIKVGIGKYTPEYVFIRVRHVMLGEYAFRVEVCEETK